MKCNSCVEDCLKEGKLFCPKCRELGVKKELSVFCGQKCFRDSWADHKRLHQAAKALSKPTPEVNSSGETTAQLSRELAAAKEQLKGQGRQIMNSQSIIQKLTTEVSNLREEVKQDFIASSREELEYEEAHAKLVEDMNNKELVWQEKLVHAEAEAQAAVQLLKNKDKEIEQLQENMSDILERNESSSQAHSDLLQSQLKSLQIEVIEKDNKFKEAQALHKDQLVSVEEKIRTELKLKYEEEMELTVVKVKGEGQLHLKNSLEQQAAESAASFKKRESESLLSLQTRLEREMRDSLDLREEEYKQASVTQQRTLLAEKEAALEAQKAELDTANEAKLNRLADTHSESQERSARQLAEVKREFVDEKAGLLEAHRQEVHAVKETCSDLETKLESLAAQHDLELKAALTECRKENEKIVEEAVKNVRQDMQAQVDRAYADREEYLQLYTKESKYRKAIHNKLLDIQGNIRVMCRVRPILDIERKQAKGEDVNVAEFLSDEDIIINRDKFTRSRFEFDRVFPPGGTQESVFDAVQPLIISVLDGYNVCIFAYGQTGSGKTYTMEGYGESLESKGVSPRAITELFAHIDKSENWNYEVKFSMLEIYNETIRDLLTEPATMNGSKEPKLDIRQTAEGNVVTGLSEMVVENPSNVLDLMKRAQSNRAVGSHDMNEHSSRSHSILTLTVRGLNNKDQSTSFGKLHLIDLAGSERVGKTDATGDRLKEAQNINRSLSALGDVINSLGSKKSSHVPYRNSKLTYLLQDSLGGNSKVMMFVNISPAMYNANESICSLNFAFRCRNVELGQAKKQTGSVAKENSTNGSSQAMSSGGVNSSALSSRKTSSTTGTRRQSIVKK